MIIGPLAVLEEDSAMKLFTAMLALVSIHQRRGHPLPSRPLLLQHCHLALVSDVARSAVLEAKSATRLIRATLSVALRIHALG